MMPVSLAERPAGQVSVPRLVERRLPGELFPRVPVGSVQLTREQVATGLFTRLYRLPVLPTDVELMAALADALNAHGLAGLNARRADLDAEGATKQAVGSAWSYAYRLCVEHWYVGGLAEPISQSMMAVALYASDLPGRGSQELRGRTHEIDGFLAEGIARLGIEAVVQLAADLAREFPSTCKRAKVSELSAAYLDAMPARQRRRACFTVAVNRQLWGPRPLTVWLDDGRYAIGVTPPEDPRTITWEQLTGSDSAQATA
ncbi:hypothetical protein [Streptomyces sp. ISL-11]|uniref:hypothetical protein n=1 Tax=Streptomyces sp. ISL-11 TaxID=2819174 RepID=UPI001BEB3CE7|nr:hypothetical protein [Streptomyces sp. ISL-11]MBT2387246.1 hypothetical protein [Streptomyces sp. ISL-11]